MIIGPSGSGKDTLISGAKLLLNNENRFVFAQREITRPQTDDAEGHIEISESEFKQKQLENVYSLSWYANGLNYGVTRLDEYISCLLYTSPSPRDQRGSRMPSSA